MSKWHVISGVSCSPSWAKRKGHAGTPAGGLEDTAFAGLVRPMMHPTQALVLPDILGSVPSRDEGQILQQEVFTRVLS